MFHEIKRPFKVIKQQIFTKINVFSSSREMIENVNEAITEENLKPPVATDVSKSEFKRRYKGLCIHASIALFVFFYTLLFVATSQSLLAFIVSGLIASFFFVNYFLSIYRGWVARYYFMNWEDRFINKKLSFRQFLDSIYESPILLLPIFKIDKGI